MNVYGKEYARASIYLKPDVKNLLDETVLMTGWSQSKVVSEALKEYQVKAGVIEANGKKYRYGNEAEKERLENWLKERDDIV